jgi:RNA polymerase sigma factor (sigma-70 family)
MASMVERSESSRDGADLSIVGIAMTAPDINDWFMRDVLPLEPALMQFLRRCVRDAAAIPDLRQDVYVRIYEMARKQIPYPVKPLLLLTARNLVIDRVRRDQVVSIETVADLEELDMAADEPDAERSVIARQELRRLQAALDRLPPRCRQAMTLRKIEGLQRREIAARMGISEPTVAKYLAAGMYALAEFLAGDNNVGSVQS